MTHDAPKMLAAAVHNTHSCAVDASMKMATDTTQIGYFAEFAGSSCYRTRWWRRSVSLHSKCPRTRKIRSPALFACHPRVARNRSTSAAQRWQVKSRIDRAAPSMCCGEAFSITAISSWKPSSGGGRRNAARARALCCSRVGCASASNPPSGRKSRPDVEAGAMRTSPANRPGLASAALRTAAAPRLCPTATGRRRSSASQRATSGAAHRGPNARPPGWSRYLTGDGRVCLPVKTRNAPAMALAPGADTAWSFSPGGSFCSCCRPPRNTRSALSSAVTPGLQVAAPIGGSRTGLRRVTSRESLDSYVNDPAPGHILPSGASLEPMTTRAKPRRTNQADIARSRGCRFQGHTRWVPAVLDFMRFLGASRLAFREMTNGDLDDMAALLGDEDVMRYSQAQEPHRGPRLDRVESAQLP